MRKVLIIIDKALFGKSTPGETPRDQGRPYRHPGAGLQVAEISSVQKTQVCGARAAEVHGVSEKQVSYE